MVKIQSVAKNVHMCQSSLAARPPPRVVSAMRRTAKPRGPAHAEKVEQNLHSNEFYTLRGKAMRPGTRSTKAMNIIEMNRFSEI